MDYALIELGDEHWIVAEIVARTASCDAAWVALGRGERGCVVELADGHWAACRALPINRPTRGSASPFHPAKGAAFESRRHTPDGEEDDPRITSALKQLLMRGDARFERRRDGGEQWFAN